MLFFGGKPKESAAELFEKGGEELEAGRLKKAVHYYKKAIKADPNLARAWLNKGVCLFELGKYKDAQNHFERAIQIDPSTRNDLKSFFSLQGSNLQKLGKLHDALSYFEKALEVDSNDWSIWFHKGGVLLELGKQDESVASYKKAAEINPQKATMGVVGILMELGRFEEAIPYLDKAIDINPRDNEAWCAKGICLTTLNKMEGALPCLDKALEIDQKDGKAWYLKSMVLSLLHRDKEEIKICLRNAIEFDPKYVIERTNEVGLPDEFPLSAQEWLEEIAYSKDEVGVRLAHTYYDLCVSDPNAGLEAVESLLHKHPELASNSTVCVAKAMAYMAKGFQGLQERIETGEVDLPVAKSDELRLYLNDEKLNYLESALSEIHKVEDTHPQFVEGTGRMEAKVDAMAIALERCIPGRVQATLGKTKLHYFGTERIGINRRGAGLSDLNFKPFLDIFFTCDQIGRSALILNSGKDARGRSYIFLALYKRPQVFNERGEQNPIARFMFLFDDGTFHIGTSRPEEHEE